MPILSYIGRVGAAVGLLFGVEASAQQEKQVRIHFHLCGGKTYITKPLHRSDCVPAIERMLELERKGAAVLATIPPHLSDLAARLRTANADLRRSRSLLQRVVATTPSLPARCGRIASDEENAACIDVVAVLTEMPEVKDFIMDR